MTIDLASVRHSTFPLRTSIRHVSRVIQNSPVMVIENSPPMV